MSQCFAIGNISTNNFGGGLVGYLHKYSSLQQCYSLGDFERLGSATYFGGLIGAKFLNSPQPIIQDVYRNSDALTDGGYVPNASGTALSAYHMEDELNFEGFAFDANPGNFSMKEDSFKPAWFNETHFPYPMLNFY